MRLPSCRRLPQHLKMLCVTSNSLPTTEEFEQKQNLFLMCYLLFNTLSILSFRRPILYRASFLWGDLFPPSSFTDTYISSYYQLLQRHNREASRLPSHCHKDHHHRDCSSTGSSERLRREIPSQYLMLFCCCCCYWNLWDGTQPFKGHTTPGSCCGNRASSSSAPHAPILETPAGFLSLTNLLCFLEGKK